MVKDYEQIEMKKIIIRIFIVGLIVLIGIQVVLIVSGWYGKSIALSSSGGGIESWNSETKETAKKSDYKYFAEEFGVINGDTYLFTSFIFNKKECITKYELHINAVVNSGSADLEIYRLLYTPHFGEKVTEPSKYELVETLTIDKTGTYVMDLTNYSNNVWYGINVRTDWESDFSIEYMDYAEAPRWRCILSDLKCSHDWLPFEMIDPNTGWPE